MLERLRMDYGDAKVKTMARSLLPSRRRKGAREDKRLAHRHHRRQVSERLGQLRWCDYDDFIPSVVHNNNWRIHEIKWERRAADDASAVERWAEALTRDVPKGERVAFMKGLLPDNLIGRHAEINIAIKRAHRAGHNRSRYDRSADKPIEWVDQKDCCTAPVLLAGSHDVDNFIDRLIHTEHREWADSIWKLSELLGGVRHR